MVALAAAEAASVDVRNPAGSDVGTGQALPERSRLLACPLPPRPKELTVVKRPDTMNAFEFAVLSGLRAAQLHRGCTPRVEPSEKVAITAQREVAEHKVLLLRETPVVPISEPIE